MQEITFEITNYCPHDCSFCSSNTTNYLPEAKHLTIEQIVNYIVKHGPINRIILSGGEPLAHPNFYEILNYCQLHSDDVVVYSNAIRHIVFNPHVIDGIYLEANLTINENVENVHVLKRVKQGREKTRPEVKFSRNWTDDCACDSKVMLPNGIIVKSPCNKNKDV